MRFTSLEVLWLDDNKLTDQTIFSTLAGLRKYASVQQMYSMHVHIHTYTIIHVIQHIHVVIGRNTKTVPTSPHTSLLTG